MNKLSGYLAIIIFVVFLSVLFYFIDEIYLERTVTAESGDAKIEFQIEKGEGLNSVISRLKDEGFVRNKFLVRLYTFFSQAGSVKPGSYLIGPKYSVRDIFVSFNEGSDVEVKIFEGWTVKDIASALEERGVIKSIGDLFKLAKNFDNSSGEYDFLPKERGVDLEGYLFPDTYRFQRGLETSAIEMMLDNFDKKVYSHYSSTADELKNILVMASMLEREVQTQEDMRLVSGILWKRFESEVGLQVDATLVYIKCVLMVDSDKTDPSCRQITNGDKSLDSLYNTYLHKGLPPGAISNPGLKAIEAAMNPFESGYWYYLSARDDGRTIFSETLDEHNQNRVIYR